MPASPSSERTTLSRVSNHWVSTSHWLPELTAVLVVFPSAVIHDTAA